MSWIEQTCLVLDGLQDASLDESAILFQLQMLNRKLILTQDSGHMANNFLLATRLPQASDYTLMFSQQFLLKKQLLRFEDWESCRK